MASPWPGPLTEPELKQFGENGYLELEGLFSGEEVERIAKRVDRLLARSSDDEPGVARHDGQLRSVFAVHDSDERFRELASDPRIVERAEQLLSSHVYLHQSRVDTSPAFEGRERDWRSDFETWHVEDGMPRMRAVSCSIALTAHESYRGPRLLIPGSHHHLVACAEGAPDRVAIAQLAERRGVRAFTGRPGDVLLLECNLLHGTGSNISPWPRTDVLFVYNSVQNALQEPYSGDAPRPEHLASRDFTPLATAG